MRPPPARTRASRAASITESPTARTAPGGGGGGGGATVVGGAGATVVGAVLATTVVDDDVDVAVDDDDDEEDDDEELLGIVSNVVGVLGDTATVASRSGVTVAAADDNPTPRAAVR